MELRLHVKMLVMARIGHKLGDYIIQKNDQTQKYMNSSFYTNDCQ